MFEPIDTQRLLLRPTRLSDAQSFFERRNDPDVAQHQDWDVPYPLEQAEAAMAALGGIDDPPIDEWWVLTVANHDDTEIYGDLVLKLGDDGRTAEVGYSFDRAHWRKGFATEALSALVDWLFFTQGVSRVSAMLHPENARSARVLESCGFLFEGYLRNSYWRGDVNEDDWVYGLTPQQYRAWLDRPRHNPDKIELVEIDASNLSQVMKLETHHSQESFVSPVMVSLAQMAVPPFEETPDGTKLDSQVVLWARVVHADGEPVGFVLVEEPTEANPEPYLMRLLVDRLYQR